MGLETVFRSEAFFGLAYSIVLSIDTLLVYQSGNLNLLLLLPEELVAWVEAESGEIESIIHSRPLVVTPIYAFIHIADNYATLMPIPNAGVSLMTLPQSLQSLWST